LRVDLISLISPPVHDKLVSFGAVHWAGVYLYLFPMTGARFP